MDSIFDSILTSIKKLLGPEENQTQFDPDIIMHINTVFADLNQLGAGPEDGFAITDKTEKWTDFISDPKKFQNIKTYMYLRVKLVFDPPESSAVIASMEREINKLEWRINAAVDPGMTPTS